MKISGFVEYVKQIWKNKPDTSTPVSAERLNHIEEGIKANSDALAALAAVVCDQVLNDPEKIASLAALYSVDKKIGNTANLPNSAADVVTALTTLNSNLGDMSKRTVDMVICQEFSTSGNFEKDNGYVIKYTIPTGYKVLSVLQIITVGWIGSVYGYIENNVEITAWVSGGTGSGSIKAYILFIKK